MPSQSIVELPGNIPQYPNWVQWQCRKFIIFFCHSLMWITGTFLRLKNLRVPSRFFTMTTGAEEQLDLLTLSLHTYFSMALQNQFLLVSGHQDICKGALPCDCVEPLAGLQELVLDKILTCSLWASSCVGSWTPKNLIIIIFLLFHLHYMHRCLWAPDHHKHMSPNCCYKVISTTLSKMFVYVCIMWH